MAGGFVCGVVVDKLDGATSESSDSRSADAAGVTLIVACGGLADALLSALKSMSSRLFAVLGTASTCGVTPNNIRQTVRNATYGTG